ncbi:cupin domain-containing protein [Priestia koreensis]|uniref:cupin domain-containing protein n=1 Tax=Priestia koreensis TaxID=284581 RepID=UPI001F595807|nr:cupin domain-containing protein [Priestia koreensis]MCM3005073.1 cupin domain-containing protein [Priestia koreensis]UNL83062.1 cupin domain-containing protein [Priestia koreensis]
MRKKTFIASLLVAIFLCPLYAEAKQPIYQYGPGEKLGNTWGGLPLQPYLDSLPKTSKKAVEDRTVVSMPKGGVRVFRLYRPSAPHYHTKSDAILYVLSGKGTYEVADGKTIEAEPGTMMYWRAGTPHALVKLTEGPQDILIFDVGVRSPSDIIYLDPKDEGKFSLD